MADSDDDSDKKKRDKFRRERSDYTDRPRRSDHGDRRGWREDYYDQRRRSRDDYEDDRERRRFSPPGRREWGSPPPKRSRREGWESLRDYGMGMVPPPFGIMERRGGWMMHDMPPGAPMPPGARSLPSDMMMGYGSPMGDPHHRRVTLLTFKQFLVQQDDNINDQEAFRMYQEYKTDFKKKQVQQFFNDHKEEDWFLAKYHPRHLEVNKKEERKNLHSRLQVFIKLLNNGTLDETPMTVSAANAITRVMDTAVILMEGGTERDLLSLDHTSDQEEEEEEEEVEEAKPEPVIKKEDSVPREEQSVSSHDKDSNESSPPKPSFMMTEPTPEQQRLVQQAKDYQRQRMESTGEVIAANTESEGSQKKSRKRKRDAYSFDNAEDASSSSEDDAQDEESEAEEPPPPGMEENDEPPPPGIDVEMSDQLQDQADQEEEEESKAMDDEELNKPAKPQSDKPNPLHLTKAVYIRHIPPSISSSDILEVCRAFPGYLRMAFGDPLPDKGYERRGWVTFSNETSIKDVCTKLNSEKIKNIQLSCQVNRDLTRRVKSISGVTWSRKVILGDLELLKKVTQALDKQQMLWNYAEEDDEYTAGVLEMDADDAKCNPVINFSEQQLLAGEQQEEKTVEEDEDDEEGAIRDPGTELVSASSPIIQVLDRLTWYLRLVHSVDYYNGTVFPDEDHMPHRCGIITARLPRPASVNLEDITEHIRSMESKLQPLLVSKETLSEEDVEKLGKRDHDTEVEKFVEVNTVKQSENKYLCPLSGKKFKGIEFVRKHIFNKHLAKVEEVKDETDFFNNYLRDPSRPIPLDGSGVIAAIGGGGRPGRPGGEDGAGRLGPPDWGKESGRGFPPDTMGGGFGRGGFPGRRPFRGMRGGRGGPRRQIQRYNDLDAPEDPY